MSYNREDLDFATEYKAAINQGPPRTTAVFLTTLVIVFVSFLAWANWAELDEVTRGEGRVIASSKNQVVQSLEGGIVKEILVKTGDVVKKGDVLLKIDDTGFSSNFGELRAKQASLQAQVVRLKHELTGVSGTPPVFPPALNEMAGDTIRTELQLYDARQRSLKSQIVILQERVKQRRRELSELKANLERISQNLKLAREEEKIKEPLARRGIVPKTDVIRLKREIADLEGQIRSSGESVPRLEAAIREAEALANEQTLKFRQDAQTELSQRTAELAVVAESIRAARDRVVRADVRSPVEGIVNSLNVNTVGGVVRAGETLVEIVPVEENLLIEAKVRPSDIAFVRPDQSALVKITAYDFSIYGGLDGVVEKISADSSIDEVSREVFYLVTVKTLSNQLGEKQNKLSIIPGMVASVDILTGKKSVLDYLLKPINKARYEALRER
ncbi:MAG: HlyD family type I secretion periplasmic adaptor subunit [Rhizobiales bacterium]|nr:HlyD family type I secretion periplasmic adaptor subunit [Hyphomicrobiales bacterium]